MNPNAASGRVVIVLASIDAETTIAASLAAFLRELGDRGEILLVDASSDPSGNLAERFSPRVQVVRRPHGRLAPELWRDGLSMISDAEYVAFSTAQMIPREGWLRSALNSLQQKRATGVGGPIAPANGLSRVDRALYLLRYANYFPPIAHETQFEPPGDNALYRFNALRKVKESWREGFWELRVHRALRCNGETLAAAPEAAVEFAGGSSLKSALAHRLAHARHFGASRALGQNLITRITWAARAPLVPFILASRIVRNLLRHGEPMQTWLAAVPNLALLVSAWSLGEAVGGLFGPPKQRFTAS